jgi:hypothetical protein
MISSAKPANNKCEKNALAKCPTRESLAPREKKFTFGPSF